MIRIQCQAEIAEGGPEIDAGAPRIGLRPDGFKEAFFVHGLRVLEEQELQRPSGRLALEADGGSRHEHLERTEQRDVNPGQRRLLDHPRVG